MSNGIQEEGRLANVGGDVQLGKYLKGEKASVESDLAKYASQAKERTGGQYAEEDLIETLIFLSNFAEKTPFAPIAIPLKWGLRGYDWLRDAGYRKKQKDKIRDLESELIAKHKGTPYEDYLLTGADDVGTQAEKAIKSGAKMDLIAGAIDVGMDVAKVLPGDNKIKKLINEIIPMSELGETKLSEMFKGFAKEGGKEVLEEGSKEVVEEATKEALKEVVEGGAEETIKEGGEKGFISKLIAKLGSDAQSPVEGTPLIYRPGGVPKDDLIADTITDASQRSGTFHAKEDVGKLLDKLGFMEGYGEYSDMLKMPTMPKMPKMSGLGEPTLYDIASYATPRVMRSMRGRTGARVPAAPGMRRPSIRRRIT
jgi:hypothetical protein